MKKLFSRLQNLGVQPNMPAQEQARIRTINFLELIIQGLFFSYLFIAIFLIHSTFMIVLASALIVTGWIGLWLNSLYQHEPARTVLLCSSSFLLLIVCNSINAHQYFIIFYFILFATFGLYYDLEKDLSKAIFNLGVTLGCAVCSYSLPPQLVWQVNLEPQWIEFFKAVNYPVCFFITNLYIILIVVHINKTSRELINTARIAEQQKFEMLEDKLKAETLALTQSRFVSNMSHELRTPLNGIIGTVQIMLQEQKLPSQEHNFDVLKFSSEHMMSLINDVLDFSKIEAGKMELSANIFNLKDTVNKIATIFEGQFASKQVEFKVQTDKQVNRYFQGDETRLNQVINNLISNAMKFTSSGSVKLTVKLLDADSNTANIMFSVRDTGIGISPEKQAQIFQAFNQGEGSTTRKFGGTGLGLTISKKLVTLLGGQLKLESETGKGSHFYFTIQLAFSQDNKAFVNEKKVGSLESLKGMRVLVAEDSPVNMIITRKFLQRWEVDLTEAQNGKQTVEMFDKDFFDVLLIDLDMPVMDGYDAIAAIRQKDPDIPAIAFTAAVLPNMKQQLQDKGFTDFLQKPFRPEDLHKKLSVYGLAKI